MSDQAIVKEYTNGDFTVVWKHKKWIHSGICVQLLPEVYDPNDKPWIKPANATNEQLTSQIDKCPSGALSYRIAGESEKDEIKNNMDTKVEIKPNGPLIVQGTVEVKGVDGSTEIKKRSTAFCRCGASNNKPYCDGTHNTSGFKG